MEDSFKLRIDRTFGTLSSSSSSSSSQPLNSSLWSLTDDELQKNQWTREPDDPLSDNVSDDDDEFRSSRSDAAAVDRFFLAAAADGDNHSISKPAVQSPNPNPSPNMSDAVIGKVMVVDIEQLCADDDNEEYADDDARVGAGASEGCDDGRKGGDDDEPASSSQFREGIDSIREGVDDLDVLNSIGLDSTLDFEEEEDEYDKVAVGEVEPDQRLYMSDASDYTSHIDSFYEFPTTFKEAPRDPRANHLAAKLRLKEDAETAKNFNSLHVSEESSPVVSTAPSEIYNDGNKIKSILKRKVDQMDSKSDKRVRFDSSCKQNDGGEYESWINVTPDSVGEEITLHENVSSEHQLSSLVPDYIRNPSKYTHYTFDSSSDMNEESNRQAYADFLGMLKKSKGSNPDEVPADLSKPVVFNPKKKPREASAVISNEADHAMEVPLHRKRLPVSIIVGDEPDNEACEMDVDEEVATPIKDGNVRRRGRQYRSKPCMEHDESDS